MITRLHKDHVQLPVTERVQNGLQWLKSHAPTWKAKDYRALSSVIGSECVLDIAVEGGYLAHFMRMPEGSLFYGFNAYSAADDIEVTLEWRRVLAAEGVQV